MPLSTSSPAASASATRGVTPIPATTKSAPTMRPPVSRTPITLPSSPATRLDLRAADERHSVVGVDVAVDRAELGPEHSRQRQLVHLHHRHLAAALARRRGDLGADPARADRHQPPALVDALADRLGVGDRAQRQHAVEIGAGDRQLARLRRRSRSAAGCTRAPRPRPGRPARRRGRSTRPSSRSAARSPDRRRTTRRGRRAWRRPRHAGSPWTAAGARRDARPPGRSAPRGRRSPPRAASLRPWRRRARRRR